MAEPCGSLAELRAALDGGRTSAARAGRAEPRARRRRSSRSCTRSCACARDAARAEAREADARRARGERRSPLDGIPVAIKDNLVQRGEPTTCASRILAGLRLALRRDGGGEARRRGRDRRSAPPISTSSRWARRPRTRRSARRAIPGTRAHAGRIVGRLGRRGRGGHRADRVRQRHGRLDPPARVVLRRGRREADLRPRLALGPGRVRVLARPDRRVRAQRRRRGGRARGDLRPRPARLHLAAGARAAARERALGRRLGARDRAAARVLRDARAPSRPCSTRCAARWPSSRPRARRCARCRCRTRRTRSPPTT